MFALQPPSPEAKFLILLTIFLGAVVGFGYLIDEALK